MLSFTSIASGSNGNCYYIGTSQEGVLIDAGIPARQILQRMNNLGLTPATLKGIFITHEHTDHIKGVENFSQTFDLPVYLTAKTARSLSLSLPIENIRIINKESTTSFDALSVISFPKLHDASDPVSFRVTCSGYTISVLTDIGFPCEHVIHSVEESDILFIESNYEESLLMEGDYPEFLKKRITGRNGHLSNLDAARLVYKYATPRLKYLFLSHLSENNNSGAYARGMMNQALDKREDLNPELIVAPRHQELPLRAINITQDYKSEALPSGLHGNLL
jgi:phosphoribosyl 1,2-cyclic phosphodiesterase